MSKKPRRTKPDKAAAPQSTQLEAVRKLARSGRYQEAHARVAELRARYPGFKPLLALAWEVEDAAGNFFNAALHAWDWSQASPGSLTALQALYGAAMAANLPALGALAAKRLAETEGKSFPDLPPIPGQLADLSFEQGVAIDLSRLFLANSRFDEAVDTLEGIDHPSARNNMALARFAKGDIAAALAGFEANWGQDTRNLFALHYVVRLRLWTGGRGPASELADALATTQPIRPEDTYSQMLGLLLLGAHGEAIRAWQAVREAEFWNDEQFVLQGRCVYFAAIAALRQGEVDLARDYAVEAFDIDPDNVNAETLDLALAMRRLGKEPDPQAGEFHEWFPLTWFTKARLAFRSQAQDAVFDALCRRCDAHPDYLAVAAELGGPQVRLFALATLKRRASEGDEAALEMLRNLLTRPCGPDEVRLDLNRWLEENGYMPPGQTHKMLIQGEVKDLQLRAMRLTAEPTESGLPPADQAKLEHMHHLLAQPDLKGALHLAQQLAAAHPDHPMVLGNLAGIKDALGHPDDEVEGLYRHALELNPAYLFAQTGLARLAARKGETDQARELLRPLYSREEYHFSEWRAIMTAEREIALKQGDMARVFWASQQLRDIEEQFG